MSTILIIYIALLAIMGLVAFAAYGMDKRKAKKGAWRTSEKTLLLLAACFGGIGAFMGMKVFRHKTQHTSFRIIVPMCTIVQIAALALLIIYT
jgi:Predicted membrane protein